MIKIWAKILDEDNKIQKDIMYTKDIKFTYDDFDPILREICYQLDIPTPISLKYHINSFIQFNTTKFLPSDFVEDVDFKVFILENC